MVTTQESKSPRAGIAVRNVIQYVCDPCQVTNRRLAHHDGADLKAKGVGEGDESDSGTDVCSCVGVSERGALLRGIGSPGVARSDRRGQAGVKANAKKQDASFCVAGRLLEGG
jgi:hypothetical protein